MDRPDQTRRSTPGVDAATVPTSHGAETIVKSAICRPSLLALPSHSHHPKQSPSRSQLGDPCLAAAGCESMAVNLVAVDPAQHAVASTAHARTANANFNDKPARLESKTAAAWEPEGKTLFPPPNGDGGDAPKSALVATGSGSLAPNLAGGWAIPGVYGCFSTEGVKSPRPTTVGCDAVAASSASLGESSQSQLRAGMNQQSAAELHYSTATAQNTMV
ncbi:hypothetical protein G7Z17_g3200 [Cylindrodendrum hubeiense]|uniref:Uncharacterized protein n=1 Tax=Cylindrodendrum hubeiense TaxID=595255 RepID=A0A9P5HLM1_9HYPO|nr:hypothetical protein G7Z17_g3200 [Cylindrodendrum hubeiense]